MGSIKGIKEKIRIKDRKKATILNLVLICLAAALLTVAFFNRAYLSQHKRYLIESASEVAYGQNGNTLVIDNGKKTILVLDENDRLIQRYDGGSDDAAFHDAFYVAQDDDGSVYVADVKYGDGTRIDRERIIRLNGSKRDVVYEVDYTQMPIEDTPLQYGNILELQVYEGDIYFLLGRDDILNLYRIDDGRAHFLSRIPIRGAKTDATYDVKTNTVTAAMRWGDLYLYDLSTGQTEYLALQSGRMPYDLSAQNGEVYYTELIQRCILHFSADDPATADVFSATKTLLFKLSASPDGSRTLVTDQVGFYRLNEAGESEYVDEVEVAYFHRILLTWAALILGLLALAFPLLKLVGVLAGAAGRSDNALRVLLIVLASLSVASVLSYTLMQNIMDTSTGGTEKALELFSEILMADIDPDALMKLNGPTGYNSAPYLEVKEKLDAHTRDAYDRGDYYYYILYRSVGGRIVMVMDFEDSQPCTYPMYPDDPEDNDYAATMNTGEELAISEISSYGAWSFLLRPVYDKDGYIVAVLEVGQSLDALQRSQAELSRELLISVATITTVVTMILLELSFLISFLNNKRQSTELDNTDRVPVRTMMFFSYLADSMQDVFIAVLCSRLYPGGLPVPDGVAIALPMSAQLFMMAVFSFFAGRFAEKLGTRRVMTTGVAVQFSGFVLCAALGSYWGLIIGKMLIGAGMGIIYVSCNTVAASAESSEKSASAFAGVSAGTLSGLTIGAGLSSVLLSIGGWRGIYFVGAAILAIAWGLSITSGNVTPGKSELDISMEQHTTFPKFMFRHRVIGFFALMLVPFMMALSYREYFFPLFAQESGIQEVRIGQIYLICGMLVIYIGPALSGWLLKKFHALWSVVIASAAMGLNMLLFVLFPSLPTVILGVVILSIIISFAYTCQYTYFEMTPESLAYGQGRSMGVYSVFESLGQTIGPIVYGTLLTLGYRSGIAIFCIAMVAFTALFSFVMRKDSMLYE